jgi:hypothetical protein
MKRKKLRNFSEMTLGEIEKFEAASNSIVLFDPDGKIGINFQKTHPENAPDETWLVIQIDGLEKHLVLHPTDVNNLNLYLNCPF